MASKLSVFTIITLNHIMYIYQKYDIAKTCTLDIFVAKTSSGACP